MNQCLKCFAAYNILSNYTCTKSYCNIVNCSVCLSATTCYSCYQGYQVAVEEPSKCIKMLCNINGCSNCLNSVTCGICSPGYISIGSGCKL